MDEENGRVKPLIGMVNPANFIGLILGSPDFLADHWTRISDRVVYDPAMRTGSHYLASRGRWGKECACASDIGLPLNLSNLSRFSPQQKGVVFFGNPRGKHLSDVAVYEEIMALNVLLRTHV